MITIQLMGGLGNQLFQLFSTIAYALEHGHQFIFSFSDTLDVGRTRPTYWNRFLSNLKKYTTYQHPTINNYMLENLPKYREPGFTYTNIPFVFTDRPFSLFGYYQSYKYFVKYQEDVYSLISLEQQKLDIRKEYGEILDFDYTISMHFRLGDYKNLQSHHPIMPVEYYTNAMEYILSSLYTTTDFIRVLYFCEEEDNDIVKTTIDKLRNQFNQYEHLEFVKVDDTIEDWKQLLLMASCQNHIIANSSFSWWGAYLNAYLYKIVCYPCKWFGPAMGNVNTADLFPPECDLNSNLVDGNGNWKQIQF